MKREYEALMRKVKIEAREMEKERKRLSEDSEKQLQENMRKIAAEPVPAEASKPEGALSEGGGQDKE